MMVAERNVKRFETGAVSSEAYAALSPGVRPLFRHLVATDALRGGEAEEGSASAGGGGGGGGSKL